MKKLFSKILAILLVVATVTAFSACSKSAGAPSVGPKPELDIKKAEDNLETNRYEVKKVDRRDVDSVDAYALEKGILAVKDDDYICLIEWKTKEAAEKAYDYMLNCETEFLKTKATIEWYEFILEEYGDDMYSYERTQLEDQIKAYKRENEYIVYGISGKYIWFASNESVIEDTKG